MYAQTIWDLQGFENGWSIPGKVWRTQDELEGNNNLTEGPHGSKAAARLSRSTGTGLPTWDVL